LKFLRINGPDKRQIVKNYVRRMIKQACIGSFELWNNVNENIHQMQYVEDIIWYKDNDDEIIDYNLYGLNKEIGYDIEITTQVEKRWLQ
jgi:hypothetical protein